MSQLRLRASPPAVPPGLVRRPQLETLLSRGATQPVTLLSAGPGSGKTLSVASWLAVTRSGAAAWLTVDDTDNDLPTFWADVLGALTIGAVLPEDSALAGTRPGGRVRARAGRCRSAPGSRSCRSRRAGAGRFPGKITGAAVLDSLNHLIDHQPPNLRLVLITRSDPALRLHRLRVGGGLTEIRSQDLPFTEPEAAELFEHNDLELTGEQVRVLLDRTQGWPVGLRLAAMSLSDRPVSIADGIARFTGTHRSVAEYLIGEVLDRLPPADRDFLLKTSIADRLSASLATALTGRAGQPIDAGVAGRGERLRGEPGRAGQLVPLPPVAAGSVAAPAGAGAAGTDRGPAPAGRPVVHRAGRTDPGHSARDAGAELGRGRPAADQHRPAADPHPRRSGLAAALEPAAIRATQHPALSTLLAAAVCHYHRHDFAAMLRDANAAAEFLADAPTTCGSRPRS